MTDKPQLLIVEDDMDLSEMLNSYFSVQGYAVTSMNWGEEAVKASREAPPDLVVLDIRLPDIDGYEVCRQLRSHRRTQDIPIIFLTEKRDRVDKLAGLELGVVDYITKPFDIQELRLRVRNALSRTLMKALVNAITGLPEGELIDEQLLNMLYEHDNWAILTVGLLNLESFRERYGFVAADDVLRAISLMLVNASREVGDHQDFVAHLEPERFIIITDVAYIDTLSERIQLRVQQSLQYFYPLKDREQVAGTGFENALKLDIQKLTIKDGALDDIEDLKATLGVEDDAFSGQAQPS